MNDNRKKLLVQTLRTIEILQSIEDYSSLPYAESPGRYSMLDSDYIFVHETVVRLLDLFEPMNSNGSLHPEDRTVFYSTIDQYKRVMRAVMSRLCEFLDEDENTNIFSDAYSRLIRTFEECAASELPEKGLVDLLGIRITVFRELLMDRVPVIFHDFTMCELEDMIRVYTLELKRL